MVFKVWLACGLLSIYLAFYHDFFYDEKYTFPKMDIDFIIFSFFLLIYGPIGAIALAIGWIVGNGNFEIVTESILYKYLKILFRR